MSQTEIAHETIEFLGLPLTTGMQAQDVCNLIGKASNGIFITFINPYAWHVARANKAYSAALSQMTYVLPDGIGVAVACRKISGMNCYRISFDMTSVAGSFFATLTAQGKTAMLVGGAEGIAEKVSEKLQKEYPGLKIAGCVSGFGEPEAIVARIMGMNPDIVIVAMGVPRQELLLAKLKARGYQGLAITCGGFFDQYLQATQYYPAFIDRFNLRFAYRLYKEPGRLWRRYTIEYNYFVFLFLRALIKKETVRNIELPAPSETSLKNDARNAAN